MVRELLYITIRNRRSCLLYIGVDIYPEYMMTHAETLWLTYWSFIDIKKETKDRIINILIQITKMTEEWAKKQHVELTKEYGYLYAQT